MGDFLPESSIEMKKDDKGYFRVQIDLEDGCYPYKFKVRSKSFFLTDDSANDEWVEVIDPYATEVDEAAQMAIARVQKGAKIAFLGENRIIDDYVWQHDDAERPASNKLVIYEMLVQDFAPAEDSQKGTFQSIIDKLDYLQSLGVNALELMPIQSCPMEIGWGYNLRHYFALRSSYGKPTDLKQLIDQCHERNISVLLDIVLNHSEAESPLTKIDYDYWYRREAKDPDNSWGPEFDYNHYDDNYNRYPARDFMRDMVNFWITEYHFDGLRFDAVKQLDHPDFLGWIVDEAGLAAQPKSLFTAAEHIPEKPELSGLEGPVDSSWRVSFHYNFLDLLLKPDPHLDLVKQLIDPTQQGFQSTPNIINYLTSHDQNRLMANLADADIFDEAAFKRSKLGAALVMTAMGIPMIWMGEEFGAYKHKTLDPAPLDWRLLDNGTNSGLLKYYQGLIALRKENAALCSDNISVFHENPQDNVIGYLRWHEMGTQVAVIVNCSNNYIADYTVSNLAEDGTWHEWTKNYDIQVEGGNLTMDLPEYEAQVLVWQ
ncbi:MAG: 1,4-alpha-glucan branching enzyme [Phormidesmis priestleyi Ana]|uniref:1,4-alpha-glucan branching enzyme n=1 Tax=Phormidesmis priestleyi Ana TaxID=1666911 RepID=A0A0P7ZN23_9CYAN|nr:MAG: 1,4-alpha-glucan branching enzyme [Phormidesmis priestleyi Ana]